jgi:Flp pilus assembly protein TadD
VAGIVASCLALAAGVSACGGSSKPASSQGHQTQQQRLVAAMTNFARCARSQGVPVPDPDVNGTIPGIESLAQRYENTPQGQTVIRTCNRQLRAARELVQAQDTASRAAKVAFARCMRNNGVGVADPGPDGQLVARKIDKSSPQVRAAATACDHLLQRTGQG